MLLFLSNIWFIKVHTFKSLALTQAYQSAHLGTQRRSPRRPRPPKELTQAPQVANNILTKVLALRPLIKAQLCLALHILVMVSPWRLLGKALASCRNKKQRGKLATLTFGEAAKVPWQLGVYKLLWKRRRGCLAAKASALVAGSILSWVSHNPQTLPITCRIKSGEQKTKFSTTFICRLRRGPKQDLEENP